MLGASLGAPGDLQAEALAHGAPVRLPDAVEVAAVVENGEPLYYRDRHVGQVDGAVERAATSAATISIATVSECEVAFASSSGWTSPPAVRGGYCALCEGVPATSWNVTPSSSERTIPLSATAA